jgi:hypothetical protein
MQLFNRKSKIPNLKSLARTCGTFTKNAIAQSAVWRLGPSNPLITGNRSQLFNRKSKIPNLKSLARTCGTFTKNAIAQSAVWRLGPSNPLITGNRAQLFNRKSKIENRKSIDRTCGIFTKNAIAQSAVWRLRPSISLRTGNRGQSIWDLRFSIKTRSHLRNFHQKCERSVCCLTIRPLEPLNNREQNSIIQSKIKNRKSKIDRIFNRKSKI